MVPDVKIVSMMIPATKAAASTTTGLVDTLGYDYCVINTEHGATATDSLAMTFVQCSESDTAPTAYTDGTAIVALTGAAATSATAGFVLPTPSTCTVVPVGGNFQFNIDLKGRKRYLVMLVTPAQTMALACHAILSRVADGPASPVIAVATNSTIAHQCRLNVSC